MSSEPVRLLEGTDASDVERALLRVGRSRAPVAYDVEAGAARFRTQLAAFAAAGAVAAGAGLGASRAAFRGKALLSKLAFKIVIGLMAGGVFAGAGVVAGMHMAKAPAHIDASPAASKADAVVAAHPSPPAPPTVQAPPPVTSVDSLAVARTQSAGPRPPHEVSRRASTQAVHAFAAPTDTAEVHDDRVDEPHATATTAAIATQPRADDAPRAAEPPPSAPPSARPELLSEVRAVALARSLVERDPDAALDLLDKLRRQRPTGYFLEERQALTVLALSRAGHQNAARQQAAAFLRAYPNGPFSDRVRAVK
jgi:hypothetical protein